MYLISVQIYGLCDNFDPPEDSIDRRRRDRRRDRRRGQEEIEEKTEEKIEEQTEMETEEKIENETEEEIEKRYQKQTEERRLHDAECMSNLTIYFNNSSLLEI